jgi:hypothetical protein
VKKYEIKSDKIKVAILGMRGIIFGKRKGGHTICGIFLGRPMFKNANPLPDVASGKLIRER